MNQGSLSHPAGEKQQNNGGQQASTHEVFLWDASCFSSTLHTESFEQLGCHGKDACLKTLSRKIVKLSWQTGCKVSDSCAQISAPILAVAERENPTLYADAWSS